jgi:outer membrane protein assembly factor BamD (BamD/ComL family)
VSSIAACSHFPIPWQARHQIEGAKVLLKKGDFDAALKDTEAVLRTSPETMGDEALYLIGIIYAHPQNPGSNWQRALESFQTLIEKYPGSEFVQASEAWSSLLLKITETEREIAQLKDMINTKQGEVENLKNQIDNLKKIDLGIEEKKRRNLPQ